MWIQCNTLKQDLYSFEYIQTNVDLSIDRSINQLINLVYCVTKKKQIYKTEREVSEMKSNGTTACFQPNKNTDDDHQKKTLKPQVKLHNVTHSTDNAPQRWSLFFKILYQSEEFFKMYFN